MVKRYDLVEDGRLGLSNGGRWVRYDDYAKMAYLCKRMSVLLKCTPVAIINASSGYAKQLRAVIAEADEVIDVNGKTKQP